MGWLFSARWATRDDMLAHLRRPERFGEDYELLQSSAVGNNHWYLARRKSDGLVFIGLDLIKGGTRRYPGWGYKDMDETCGPSEVNCPVSYLDKASPATGYAIDWRERVRAYHETRRKTKAVALEPGKVLAYGEWHYRLDRSIGRRGWYVTREEDGVSFRMNAHQVQAALRREVAA